MAFGTVAQKRSPQLSAGRLRHKIALAQIIATQDSTGGSDESVDVVFAEVPASIEAISGTEKATDESSVALLVRFQILVDVVLLPMQRGVGLDDDALFGPALEFFH